MNLFESSSPEKLTISADIVSIPHHAPCRAGKTTPWQAPMADRRQKKQAKPRSAAIGESSVKNDETNMAAPTTRLKPKWRDSQPPDGRKYLCLFTCTQYLSYTHMAHDITKWNP